MAITNLYTRYAYPVGTGPFPVVVMMHGFSDQASQFTQASLQRVAARGLFVIAPGMRGRDGASGTQDGSGREIYDIYDAVVQARAYYPTLAHATIAGIVGYSGGGGNAIAAACKFPDFWTIAVSHFGITDYGYHGTNSWWFEDPTRQATLTTWIGDRAAVTNPYRARNTREGIINYTGGHVYLFHDDQDTGVVIAHSQLLHDAMDAAGMTNVTENYTGVSDSPRWLHGYPNGSPLMYTEDVWAPALLASTAWTVPAAATHRVIGYIKTKRYLAWLRANGTTAYGLDAVADVTYGVTPNVYTVTPITGAIDVTITQADAKTGSATNITDPTDITVS